MAARGKTEGPRPERTGRPALYVRKKEGGRSSTWLELFFDLVFVLAIAELAHFLHDDVTPGGFAGFLLLFVPVWWAWMGFTYYADLFDTDGAVYRVAILSAMLVSIGLSVNVYGALDGGSAGFAVSYVLLRLLLVGLYAWAWRHAREARPLSARYAAGFGLGASVWLVSLLVPEPARYALWALGIAIELATAVYAQLAVLGEDGVPVQVSHLPERLGLFTIIVLGESIVLTGAGVADTDWQTGPVAVAMFGFVVVACLWWLYFDRVDESAVERAYTGGVRQLLAGFAWGYAHLFVFAGLTAAAVGVELSITGEGATASGGARAALCGGVALYLLAISVVHPLSASPLPPNVLAARLGAAGFSVVLALLGGVLAPPLFAGLLALELVALTAFEVAGARRRTRRSAKPSARSA